MNTHAPALPADVGGFLQQMGRAAETCGLRSFLVGGPVRDLLLGAPADGGTSTDLDIMVIGSALDFTKELHAIWPQYFSAYPPPKPPVHFAKFGTAKLNFSQPVLPGVLQLDFSSARRETYARPGAQPQVAPGTLEEDLARRDFSINAMALALHPEEFGRIYDHFSGMADLQQHKIKILHRRSFEDDPARLLRAVRLMVRLGFSLEEQTAGLFASAVEGKLLGALPRSRLFAEFKKALQEPDACGILSELARRGLLAQIDPLLKVGAEVAEFCRRAADAKRQTTWEELLGLLAADASDDAYRSLLEGFGLSKRQCERVLEMRRDDSHADE